jgi:hypothetical protein
MAEYDKQMQEKYVKTELTNIGSQGAKVEANYDSIKKEGYLQQIGGAPIDEQVIPDHNGQMTNQQLQLSDPANAGFMGQQQNQGQFVDPSKQFQIPMGH